MRDPESSWTYPVGRECLDDHLRLARALRKATGEPFSFEAAAVDLYVDTDRGGTPRAQSGDQGYTTRWGWSRAQVRERWQELLERVEGWRTAYGRLLADNNHEETTEQPRNNHEIPESDENSNGDNHAITTEQPRSNQADIYRQPDGTNSNSNAQHPDPPSGEESEEGDGSKQKRSRGYSAARIEEIYQAYPRKDGKRAALKAIRSALKRLDTSELPQDARDAGIAPDDWLLGRVEEYAAIVTAAPAERQVFAPYPQKWFNQGYYFTDASEWRRSFRVEQTATVLSHGDYMALAERERQSMRPIHSNGVVSWISREATTPAGYASGRP